MFPAIIFTIVGILLVITSIIEIISIGRTRDGYRLDILTALIMTALTISYIASVIIVLT